MKENKWVRNFFSTLDNTRDHFIRYARERGKSQESNEIKNLYKSVFERLLEKPRIGKENTRNTLLVGFLENLDEIAIATALRPNNELVDMTTRLLFQLAIVAIEYRDVGYLGRVLWHYRRIYALALNNKQPEVITTEIAKKTWLHIMDLCRVYIKIAIEKEIAEKTETLIDIAEKPLIELNWVAKFAVDNSITSAFSSFVNTIRAVDIYSNPDEDDHLDERWQRQLAEARGIKDEGGVGRVDYIREALWKIRNTCFMGLGGWVIEKCRDKKITVEKAKEMMVYLSIPFDDFLDVVFHPIDRPEESRFGWMDWAWKWEDREESPYGYRGVMHGPPTWIHDFFFVEAVKNYKYERSWSEIKFKPPAATSIKFFREDLDRELNRLKNEDVFKQLVGLRDEEFNTALEKVKGYLINIEQTALKEEKEWIKNQPIVESKYALIKYNFSNGYEENALLRLILAAHDAVKETEEELPKVRVLGVRDLRDFYISREDAQGLERHWKEVGRESAGGESVYVIQQILKNSPPKDIKGTAEEVISQIETVLSDMTQDDLAPQVILLLGWVFGWRSWQAFEGNPYFKKTIEGQEVYPQQKGTFHDVPIVDIWWSKQNPLLLILAPKSVQLKDKKLGEGYNQLFEFKFDDWAEEGKAQEVLDHYKGQYPDSKTGELLTGAKAILEIQQRVLVQIFQSLAVEVLDPRGVRFFKVKIEGEEKG